MKGRLFLNVVVLQSSAVFKLSAAEDQLLLIGRNTFFVLNLLFDILDRVGGFDLKRDRFAGECLDEDLHRECSLRIFNR